MTNEYNDTEMKELDELLRPKIDFHVSDRLRENVQHEIETPHKFSHRHLIWPWLAAACVAAVISIVLAPPKSANADQAETTHAYHRQIDDEFLVHDYDEMNMHNNFSSIEKKMQARCVKLEVDINASLEIN